MVWCLQKGVLSDVIKSLRLCVRILQGVLGEPLGPAYLYDVCPLVAEAIGGEKAGGGTFCVYVGVRGGGRILESLDLLPSRSEQHEV